MSDLDDKYPYWRDAIENSDFFANLRCGGKYSVWHIAYGLLALILLIVLVFILSGRLLFRRLPTQLGVNIGKRTIDIVSSERAKRTVNYGLIGVLSILASLLIFASLYRTYQNPAEVGGLAIVLSAFCVIIYMIYFVAQKIKQLVVFILHRINDQKQVKDIQMRVKNVGEKSKETPIARRIYGKCPVSFDIEPKWFRKLKNRIDSIIES